MKTTIKLAIPLSCLLLLCSCGTDVAANTDSSSKTSGKKEKIELKDYFSMTFDGYDTVGYQTSERLDIESMFKDHTAAFGLKEPYTADADAIQASQVIKEHLKYTCETDKASRLSNGDKITVKWDEGYKVLNDTYNVELIADDFEITVEGLKELTEVDPFEYIVVEYRGDEDNRVFDIGTGHFSNIKGVAEPETAKVGDTIKISLEVASPSMYSNNHLETTEEAFAESGYKPTRLEKEYTVE